jgi:hypothetical protein
LAGTVYAFRDIVMVTFQGMSLALLFLIRGGGERWPCKPPRSTGPVSLRLERERNHYDGIAREAQVSENAKKRWGRGAPVHPTDANIVSTWRRLMTDGGTLPLSDALKSLNQDLGTNYRHDRITAWEQALGGRKPNVQVYEYMLSVVIPLLLEQWKRGEINEGDIVAAVALPRTDSEVAGE